jgi:hypothetical protein
MFLQDPDCFPSLIPDLGSRIPNLGFLVPDPGSKKKGEERKKFVSTFFVAINYLKLKLPYLTFFQQVKKKFRV